MSGEVIGKNFQISNLADLDPTPCPCEQSRRAFMNDENTVASMHLVEIKQDSELHYHKRMTELYYVLEGEGHIEVDGEVHPLTPGTAVLIKPGCRHRAMGSDLKILNVSVPKFDPKTNTPPEPLPSKRYGIQPNRGNHRRHQGRQTRHYRR